MSSAVVVIGVGNDFRRDDGVGPAVARAAAPHLPEGVPVLMLDGEPTALIESWTGAGVAVMVDAVRFEPACAGRMHRLQVSDLSEAADARGTHGLGMAAAVALGRSLGRLPERLEVIGIEPADVGTGLGLSSAVECTVPAAAKLVVGLVEAILASSSEPTANSGPRALPDRDT